MNIPARTLARLERTPLLGRHLPEVRRDLGRLAAQVAVGGDPALEAALLAVGAHLALAEGAPDALTSLQAATTAAARAGDLVREDSLRLLTVRALAQARQTVRARDLLADVLGRASRTPALEADLHLARAAVGMGEAAEARRAALATLPSPARDHDRLATLLALAEELLDGAAPLQARPYLDQALALARHHAAPVARGVAAATLAALDLESGHPLRAAGHLDEALAVAHDLGDDLGLVAHGTVRAALHLAAGQPAAAAARAAEVQAAATRRHNWLGVADAVITQAAADPDLPTALARLQAEGQALRARGATAAANLLWARLAELRAEHGREVVDPLLGIEGEE